MPHLPETCFLTRPDWANSHGMTQNTNFPWVSQNIMDTRTNFRHNPTYPCTPVLYQTPQIRLPSAALCACQGLVNIVPASQLIAGDHRDFQIVLVKIVAGQSSYFVAGTSWWGASFRHVAVRPANRLRNLSISCRLWAIWNLHFQWSCGGARQVRLDRTPGSTVSNWVRS